MLPLTEGKLEVALQSIDLPRKTAKGGTAAKPIARKVKVTAILGHFRETSVHSVYHSSQSPSRSPNASLPRPPTPPKEGLSQKSSSSSGLTLDEEARKSFAEALNLRGMTSSPLPTPDQDEALPFASTPGSEDGQDAQHFTLLENGRSNMDVVLGVFPLTFHAYLYDLIKISVKEKIGGPLPRVRVYKARFRIRNPIHSRTLSRSDSMQSDSISNSASSFTSSSGGRGRERSFRASVYGGVPDSKSSLDLDLVDQDNTIAGTIRIGFSIRWNAQGEQFVPLPSPPPETPGKELESRAARNIPTPTSERASRYDSDTPPRHRSKSTPPAESHDRIKNPEFTKVTAWKELGKLSKSFFGEGFRLETTQAISAVKLVDAWIQDRKLTEPTEPLLSVCSDLQIFDELIEQLRLGTSAYGSMVLGLFGGAGIGTAVRSSKSAVLSLTGLSKSDIVIWEMAGSDTVATPRFWGLRRGRELVISIRGTMNLSDCFTDILCHAEPFCGGFTHAGFRHSTDYVYRRILPVIREELALPEGGVDPSKPWSPRVDRLLLVGHSLGGAIATLLAILLREDLPGVPVKCAAFGTPPSCDDYLATKYPDGFITVVDESDVFPRMSYGHMVDYKTYLVRAAALNKEPRPKGSIKEEHVDRQYIELDRLRSRLLGHERAAAIADSELPEEPPEVENPKLTFPGTVFYLSKSASEVTKRAPAPGSSGKEKIRRSPKPHVRCWVAQSLTAKKAILDLVVTPKAILAHLPITYERGLLRAKIFTEELKKAQSARKATS